MTDQIVQLPLDGNGKKMDTSQLTVGANTVQRQRFNIADPLSPTNIATVFAPGEARVTQEPSHLFYDDFAGGLDTVNKWKTPTTGGTGIAATNVAGNGATTLDGGTTSNSFSMLESQPLFQPTEPG